MKIVFLIISLAFTQFITAQLRMPSFLSDGMVIQQKKVNQIWGWAKAQQLVTINFKEKKYQTFANGNGEWQVFLDATDAGNAGSITVSAGEEKIELKNILVGEVWICSGQSNMEWVMSQCPEIYKDELKTANNDNIRFVVVKRTIANSPQQDVNLDKNWSAITPSSVGQCSAVAYWYAKKLFENLHVPIGLVVTSWGGTFAQSWTSLEGLHDFKNYTSAYIENVKPINLSDINKDMQAIVDKFKKTKIEKASFVKEIIQPDYDDKDWKEMYLPKEWEEQGYPTLDGVVVFRIAFKVAEEDAGKEAELNLPPVDDMDSTYINGKFIGSIYQWDAFRKYKIPAGVLKAGKNSLVIYVQDDGGGGGLNEQPDKFNVTIGNKIISLAGKAKFNIVAVLEDITGGKGVIEHQPVLLYNGMIAPLLPLSIRGAIWYQGENNTENPIEYRTLFPAMINDWRNHWGQGDFPFLFVQLSSFGALKTEPAESNWALLREAQTKTLSLSNTAMAVTTDVGEPANIHPQHKKEVGDRLADGAIKMVYGKTNKISNSPVITGYKIDGNKIVISFSNAENGLMIKGKQLKYFSIADADKKFVWADAIIKGNQVIVSSKLIQKPVAVRYAWADSPVDANLFNKEGYPVSQFRTDDWK